MGCSPLSIQTGANWVMLRAFKLILQVLALQRGAHLLHRDFWPSTLHLHNGVFVAPHVTHACVQYPLFGKSPAADMLEVYPILSLSRCSIPPCSASSMGIISPAVATTGLTAASGAQKVTKS